MRALKILCLFSFTFLFLFFTLGCGEIQNEYYEVHLIVVDEQPFYYIDPSEGKDTISANELVSGETLFIYLYEQDENVEFSYDQFFTTIENHFVEEHVTSGKLYVLATTEIDNQVTQYFIDRDSWAATQE